MDECLALAWCCCGPFTELLGELREKTTNEVEWVGSSLWVDDEARLTEGCIVTLCETDLCHEPGLFRALRHGKILKVDATTRTIRLRVALTSRLLTHEFSAPRGRLVTMARTSAPSGQLPDAPAALGRGQSILT
jgi:hypothetical protein